MPQFIVFSITPNLSIKSIFRFVIFEEIPYSSKKMRAELPSLEVPLPPEIGTSTINPSCSLNL